MAVDGQLAIEMSVSEAPDLILMDISLPVVNGWDATRAIRANPATAKIPIIALTANANESDRNQALAAGCDDYDTKPVDVVRLLEKINALLPGAENI
jgi:two-component system response regulator